MYGSIGLVHCLVTRCLIGSLPGMALPDWFSIHMSSWLSRDALVHARMKTELAHLCISHLVTRSTGGIQALLVRGVATK